MLSHLFAVHHLTNPGSITIADSDCCERFPWPADKIAGSCQTKWHPCCATCFPIDPDDGADRQDGSGASRASWPLLDPGDWTMDSADTSPPDPSGAKAGTGIVGDAKLMYGPLL